MKNEEKNNYNNNNNNTKIHRNITRRILITTVEIDLIVLDR